jgi:putative membrane protein
MNAKQEPVPVDLNRDLILREKLALERTAMANERTLLTYIRTSLYFAVAGISVKSVFTVSYSDAVEIIFWLLSGMVLVIGVARYFIQIKKLKNSRRHIGRYVLEWEDDMD